MVDKGQIRSKIDRLTNSQQGYVTRSQLLEIGMTERMITRQLAKGS